MTNAEKEKFCLLAARLISPPDEQLFAELAEGSIWSFLSEIITEWGGYPQDFAYHFFPHPKQDFILNLSREYEILFTDIQGEKISLVESTYKKWTTDQSCSLAFANRHGLLQGDYALHMAEIYRQLSLNVPPEFQATPDHLILELELLSLLFRYATPQQIKIFIADHLDWVAELKAAIDRVRPNSFYGRVIELIILFLSYEKKEGADQFYESPGVS